MADMETVTSIEFGRIARTLAPPGGVLVVLDEGGKSVALGEVE